MKILSSLSLKPFNTFSIEHHALHIISVDTTEELIDVYENEEWAALPKLVIGKGSNTLFCTDYQGVVILNKIDGIKVVEGDHFTHIAVGAGVDWPSLVEWTLDNGIDGLENLAMIPGCAGTAPIQNIGAYGIEFKDICEYVEYLDLETKKVERLMMNECQFGYRDSIFKRQLSGRAIITLVGLQLTKQWRPTLAYGTLATLDEQKTTARDVYNRVCATRSEKLPNPAKLGNAGSFFKNPVITSEQYRTLTSTFAELPGYPFGDGYKLAAGWLIDHAGLKGHTIGGAQVHKNQALVLVNSGSATSKDITDLAYYVQQVVYKKYGVMIEHEVRFMGATRETNLEEIAR
ncbi:UDP-N-acetylmuramate dehydrogenase [Aliivibrio kagoshimensis]|uniref:UDP-N-acetylmuramate dehydrogenase n=1 Tax=Aliivibrio kagoshimensis TaxID=2910230 RepID=UPI003D14D1B3